MLCVAISDAMAAEGQALSEISRLKVSCDNIDKALVQEDLAYQLCNLSVTVSSCLLCTANP